MGTENASSWIVQVCLTVITYFLYDLLRMITGLIILHAAQKPSPASGISSDLGLVAPHGGYRRFSLKNRDLPHHFRGFKATVHLLDVRHGSTHIFRRKFQRKLIIRLQKDAPCLHQSLAHGTISCLPEISALRMLLVCSACYQSDLHICDL